MPPPSENCLTRLLAKTTAGRRPTFGWGMTSCILSFSGSADICSGDSPISKVRKRCLFFLLLLHVVILLRQQAMKAQRLMQCQLQSFRISRPLILPSTRSSANSECQLPAGIHVCLVVFRSGLTERRDEGNTEPAKNQKAASLLRLRLGRCLLRLCLGGGLGCRLHHLKQRTNIASVLKLPIPGLRLVRLLGLLLFTLLPFQEIVVLLFRAPSRHSTAVHGLLAWCIDRDLNLPSCRSQSPHLEPQIHPTLLLKLKSVGASIAAALAFAASLGDAFGAAFGELLGAAWPIMQRRRDDDSHIICCAHLGRRLGLCLRLRRGLGFVEHAEI